MHCAVARSPKVSFSAYGIQVPSLLDSDSKVMLLRQSYFDQHLLPKIILVTSDKANAHQLFNLTVTNDGQLLVKMYTELDITFLGLKVPNVGIPVVEDPSQVLDKKHQSNLSGIVGWNLVQLSYNALVEKYGTSGFSSFTCPEGVNPLLFSQLCVYNNSDTSTSIELGVSTQTVSQLHEEIKPSKTEDLYKKRWQNFDDKTRHIGQVTIGSRKNPVWIPRNSVITVPGHTHKIPAKVTCLVEQAEHHNVPLGIIVNRCVAKVKARSVPIILINTTKWNIWLWQPLLTTKLYTAECHLVEYRADMEIKGDDDNISFLTVVPDTIRVQSEQVETTSTDISPPNSSERLVFGPRPDTQAADFDFEAEIQRSKNDLHSAGPLHRSHLWPSWGLLITWWGSWILWPDQTYNTNDYG